jgi:hypothetical protein
MPLNAKQKAQKIKSERLEEIMKCAEDPAYFMKTYLQIQHPTEGRLPFDLYPYQERVLENFLEHRFNIVLKSRQLGLSTMTSAYCLWLAVFHRDKNIILVANKLEVCKNMVKKVRIAWQALPVWMLEALGLQEVEAESVKYLKFTNGSSITALPTTEDVGRSEAASLVVVDEAAIIDNLDECWKSLYSTVTLGGKIVIFSTPKGKKGQFYKLWKDSVEGKNNFHRTELPWHVHPEHDQAWYDKETKGLPDSQIAEEFLCSFEGSGQTFFNPPTIEYVHNSIQEPVAYGGPTPSTPTDLWVWKAPEVDHKYIITADVARGDAEDFSGFHIIDMNTWEQAAEYLGKIPPDRYAEYLVKMGYMYNTALIVNEKNSIGLVTSMKLRDLKYPNLYWEDGDPSAKYELTEEEKDKIIPGFTTKPGNKPGNRDEILQKLSVALRDHHIKMYSSRFHEQMLSFVFNGKKGQAAKDHSDDLIMAAAWGCFIANPMGNHSNSGNNTAAAWHQAFLCSFTKSSKSISTGINTFGQEHKNIQDPFMPGMVQPNAVQPMGEYYNGVKLKPGVKAENVQRQQMINNVFGWLF